MIGARNKFFAGCVIGEAPQDIKYSGEPTKLAIGDDNVFREHVTLHRSSKMDEQTVIGSGNFLMANAHVGHNCRLGNSVVIANGAALGGYARVDDRAFVSANCLVHQFCRVGTLALMQGNSAISKDLPPFTLLRDVNDLCGLNVVGLRRAGITAEERLELKRLYQALFRSGKNLRQAVADLRKTCSSRSATTLLEFVEAANRSVCTPKRRVRHGLEEDA